jgi:uncharacterized protein (DUF433 family)
MTIRTEYPHLTSRHDGCVFIADTRYQVSQLAAEHYHHGWTAEELLRQHPDLQPQEVYAALTYFYDHYEEMVTALKQTLSTTEAMRMPTPFTRQDLISRKSISSN